METFFWVLVDPITLEPPNAAEENLPEEDFTMVSILQEDSSHPAAQIKPKSMSGKPKAKGNTPVQIAPKWKQDPKDPKLTAGERRSILKAIKCKNQRDAKENLLLKTKEENLQLKTQLLKSTQEKEQQDQKNQQLEQKLLEQEQKFQQQQVQLQEQQQLLEQQRVQFQQLEQQLWKLQQPCNLYGLVNYGQNQLQGMDFVDMDKNN